MPNFMTTTKKKRIKSQYWIENIPIRLCRGFWKVTAGVVTYYSEYANKFIPAISSVDSLQISCIRVTHAQIIKRFTKVENLRYKERLKKK